MAGSAGNSLTMQTLVIRMFPQPVLMSTKHPGRWCWAPEEPIQDPCKDDFTGKHTTSWWNFPGALDDCLAEFSPVVWTRCKTIHNKLIDGAWFWVIQITEKEYKKMQKDGTLFHVLGEQHVPG